MENVEIMIDFVEIMVNFVEIIADFVEIMVILVEIISYFVEIKVNFAVYIVVIIADFTGIRFPCSSKQNKEGRSPPFGSLFKCKLINCFFIQTLDYFDDQFHCIFIIITVQHRCM